MTFNNLTLLGGEDNICCMNKIVLLFLSVFSCLVHFSGQANAYIDKENAVVKIMNKAAGKVQTVNLPVGQNTMFEKLNIIVRSCKQNDPFDAENFFAFVEIEKNTEGKIFSGWMNANEPGDNPLQNADYDVWLVKCE